MKYQAKSHWCGPASIQNALVLLGKRRRSQKIIAECCGTTLDGTDEFGMMRGLRSLGLEFKELWMQTPQPPVGAVYLVCVDSWSHWVVVFGGDWRFVVVDPERTAKNKSENGVHVLTWAQLKKRWACAFKAEARDAGEPAYYAIEVIG